MAKRLDRNRSGRTVLRGGVEFVVVGGAAGIAQGAARVTYDIDVVYRRTSENIEKLVEALSEIQPYLRGAPPGLPFRFDSQTVQRGLNFTLTTKLGDIDLLGDIIGGGRYEDLAQYSEPVTLLGLQCLCLELEKLIEVKRAAGRPKDFEAIAELEAILEERNRRTTNS